MAEMKYLTFFTFLPEYHFIGYKIHTLLHTAVQFKHNVRKQELTHEIDPMILRYFLTGESDAVPSLSYFFPLLTNKQPLNPPAIPCPWAMVACNRQKH